MWLMFSTVANKTVGPNRCRCLYGAARGVCRGASYRLPPQLVQYLVRFHRKSYCYSLSTALSITSIIIEVTMYFVFFAPPKPKQVEVQAQADDRMRRNRAKAAAFQAKLDRKLMLEVAARRPRAGGARARACARKP